MNIEFHPSAVQEYETAAEYYEALSPELAIRFIEEIEYRIQVIRGAPTRWKQIRPGVHALLGSIFPFQINYSVLEDRIVLLSITHQRQDPEISKGRERWRTGGQ